MALGVQIFMKERRLSMKVLDKGSLIEIKGKVYKLIEQEVEEKENGN